MDGDSYAGGAKKRSFSPMGTVLLTERDTILQGTGEEGGDLSCSGEDRRGGDLPVLFWEFFTTEILFPEKGRGGAPLT